MRQESAQRSTPEARQILLTPTVKDFHKLIIPLYKYAIGQRRSPTGNPGKKGAILSLKQHPGCHYYDNSNFKSKKVTK